MYATLMDADQRCQIEGVRRSSGERERLYVQRRKSPIGEELEKTRVRKVEEKG